MVMVALACLGLLSPPEQAYSDEYTSSCVLVMDGQTPALIPVSVAVAWIKKRVPVVQYGSFLERLGMHERGDEDAVCRVCLDCIKEGMRSESCPTAVMCSIRSAWMLGWMRVRSLALCVDPCYFQLRLGPVSPTSYFASRLDFSSSLFLDPNSKMSWAAAATSVRVTQLMNSWGFSKLHVDMKIFVWIAPGSCMVQKASGTPGPIQFDDIWQCHTGTGQLLPPKSKSQMVCDTVTVPPVGDVYAIVQPSPSTWIKKRLPAVEYSDFLHKIRRQEDEDTVCAICLNGFERRHEIRELPNCCHAFHNPQRVCG
ncbi:hypothetical protein CK203_024160 [Vitis vinifera]|uniref:Uncharacterized protein n=1 Tax=Vitis vinifera TaxID=29760 RepID=A0A438I4Q6_VITVI|nr:hypothetical protein CK203_024160 [Vitis vinifera]